MNSLKIIALCENYQNSDFEGEEPEKTLERAYSLTCQIIKLASEDSGNLMDKTAPKLKRITR